MKDQFGRHIDYLRISITDKCNLRCAYCMPVEGLPWIPKADLLTYEEIAEIVRQMADLGLRRVRITGAEPLVRRDVPVLVRRLRAVDRIQDISLSTNAILLEGIAEDLKAAGVDRLRTDVELESVPGPPGNGPAEYFRLPGAQGTVAVITPLSHNYCRTCNRMRLTADGRLRTCLFGTHEVDLKTPLRETGSVVAAVEEALAGKPERHFLQLGTASGSGGLSALSQVGG